MQLNRFGTTGLLIAVLIALGAVLTRGAMGADHGYSRSTPRSCIPADRENSMDTAELAAAVGILKESEVLDGYFRRLLEESKPRICLDLPSIDCRGYLDPGENLIGIGGGLSRSEMALILAHELRHLDQFRRGYGPSLAFDMSENVRLSFAVEADAQAIATLFAWSEGAAGDPMLWQALMALEHCDDIALAFEAAIDAGATPAGATRAAFSAWYDSRWRLERYAAAAAANHLDRLDKEKAVPSAEKLPPDYFEHMCLMPDGGNYDCHLTEEIRG